MGATVGRVAGICAAQVAIIAVDLRACNARARLADVALRANAAVAARTSLVLRYHGAFASQRRASILGASVVASHVADNHRRRIHRALEVRTNQRAVAQIAVFLRRAIYILLTRTNTGAAYAFTSGALVGVGALVAVIAWRSAVGMDAAGCRVASIVGAIVAVSAVGRRHLWRALARRIAANVKVGARVLVVTGHRIVAVRATLFEVTSVICARVFVVALDLHADARAIGANVLGRANRSVIAGR